MKRPDVYDLTWEVLRRNPDYRRDFKEHKAALLKSRGHKTVIPTGTFSPDRAPWDAIPVNDPTAIAWRYGILKITDPSKPWDKLKHQPCKLPATHHKLSGVTAFLPEDNHRSPVQSFKIKDQSINKYLWLRIDPQGNLKTIERLIGDKVRQHRSLKKLFEARKQIKRRLQWLQIVDLLGDNPRFDENSFLKLSNSGLVKARGKIQQKEKDRIVERYTKGKLLIENPSLDPLRSLTEKEISDYQVNHKIFLPVAM